MATTGPGGGKLARRSRGHPGCRTPRWEAPWLARPGTEPSGVTYVVAAGNSGWDFYYPFNPDLPAAYPEVLTVAAVADSDGLPRGAGGSGCDSVQSDDTSASLSNLAATPAGAAHLVAAPGSCITATRLGGTYAMMPGTRGCPFVAFHIAWTTTTGSPQTLVGRTQTLNDGH